MRFFAFTALLAALCAAPLADARAQTLGEGLLGAVNFFGIALGANFLALFLWPFAGPLVPVLFWSLNGYLLGREYFTLVAQRRMDKAEARTLWRANRGRIWLAGTLMAAPLSIPILNLIIPVMGVATFAHLFQSLRRDGQGVISQRSEQNP